eukprot:1891466-Prymnesium_polylepis.1
MLAAATRERHQDGRPGLRAPGLRPVVRARQRHPGHGRSDRFEAIPPRVTVTPSSTFWQRTSDAMRHCTSAACVMRECARWAAPPRSWRARRSARRTPATLGRRRASSTAAASSTM